VERDQGDMEKGKRKGQALKRRKGERGGGVSAARSDIKNKTKAEREKTRKVTQKKLKA